MGSGQDNKKIRAVARQQYDDTVYVNPLKTLTVKGYVSFALTFEKSTFCP